MIIIDYDYLKDLILPSELRNKQIRNDWLSCNDHGLRTLYSIFLTKADEDYFDLNHTAQIMSIEHYINTKLAGQLNINVFITDGQLYDYTYIFNYDEPNHSEQLYCYNYDEIANKTYIYNYDEYGSSLEADYYVHISNTDILLTDIIKTYLNIYNIAGKKYTIIYY